MTEKGVCVCIRMCICVCERRYVCANVCKRVYVEREGMCVRVPLCERQMCVKFTWEPF